MNAEGKDVASVNDFDRKRVEDVFGKFRRGEVDDLDAKLFRDSRKRDLFRSGAELIERRLKKSFVFKKALSGDAHLNGVELERIRIRFDKNEHCSRRLK